MLNCAAVFVCLPQRCTTPAKLPHFPLSLLTGQAAAISVGHMAGRHKHFWAGIRTDSATHRLNHNSAKHPCATYVVYDPLLTLLLHRAYPLGQMMRWCHPPVYRPLVDLSTMEDRHIIITYRLDRATIHELCAQLEPDLMSSIRHRTGIPPLVQILSVLHFLASGSFQTTVVMASGMSQPTFSNVLSRVLSALLKHMHSYIVFPQVEDLPTVKGDFYALGHIPNIIGAIEGTHVAFVPPSRDQQVYRIRKSNHSMNAQMEDGPDVGLVAAVEPVDSEEREAEEEDIDKRNNIIMQYFQ
ncbi:hypothetical protein NDU88_001390 [Pleurodeles waltl]|uniref:Nuclease HARBI1 n=1 Tax=Pleurodeles waltl TaxID=8319 RepID=A0AAV7WP69_PLEWA|nr:hypothetical protein NDU88_001390 [Pleurodeles waltl]